MAAGCAAILVAAPAQWSQRFLTGPPDQSCRIWLLVPFHRPQPTAGESKKLPEVVEPEAFALLRGSRRFSTW